jgi:hypothetical protein
MTEVSFDIEVFPPAKNEALSMLSEGHSHAARVIRLLQAARQATVGRDFRLMDGPIGLEVIVYAPSSQDPWDATNYLGGIADVLEEKSRRGPLLHLGALRNVALYHNDRQIREVRYRQASGSAARYRVRVWRLDY